MSDDYAELKAQIFAAREIIGHLCAEGRPPRMSIPANRYTDEDMVMDAALAAADKAIDTLRAENERLREDAERLDYIEGLDHIERYYEHGPDMSGNHVWFPTQHHLRFRGLTFRAAIDAAMKAKDGPA